MYNSISVSFNILIVLFNRFDLPIPLIIFYSLSFCNCNFLLLNFSSNIKKFALYFILSSIFFLIWLSFNSIFFLRVWISASLSFSLSFSSWIIFVILSIFSLNLFSLALISFLRVETISLYLLYSFFTSLWSLNKS